ncbi:MAG: hypothetical protein M5U34_01995 [Chloroflexi bacterium]|nr:hypothetical protein [Chloroflexota bacterium]
MGLMLMSLTQIFIWIMSGVLLVVVGAAIFTEFPGLPCPGR